MRFGIFYEHQLPRPWSQDAEHDLLHQALDQVELADRLGYDYAWEVEHHFMEEYSHSSAPEVFLAAASQRTRASASATASSSSRRTTRRAAAERVSTLDLLSSGPGRARHRRGVERHELHPFDRRFRDKRLDLGGRVRCLIRCSRRGTEYHGEHFDFPLRNVVPEAPPEAAPAAVGGLLAARDHPHGRDEGHGRLGFQFVSARRRRRGSTPTTTPTRSASTRWPTTSRTRRWRW
jgi:alkanesulfonate monooxygenase SsuD/methylene tetrahydromethanopterin reductase-like flavin-dependent oxidoreductase (luciferase family)